MTLLKSLGSTGRLVTYDFRREHLNHTRKNIIFYLGRESLTRWLPVISNPSKNGFSEHAMDRLFTDVSEPWDIIEAASKALKPGGLWTAYIPTVIQMAKQVKTLNKHHYWSLVHSFEILQRFWHVYPPSVRPKHQMNGHTGFIVVSRRCF